MAAITSGKKKRLQEKKRKFSQRNSEFLLASAQQLYTPCHGQDARREQQSAGTTIRHLRHCHRGRGLNGADQDGDDKKNN